MGGVLFTVSGKASVVLNYQGKLLILNDAGTFFVDPNRRSRVRGLYDMRASHALHPGENGAYRLPTVYQRSLHSHTFQVTSACVDQAGMCISGDCAGYVHLWAPKKLVTETQGIS
jgi:hypothetical protein